jgi:hypothetical protein
MSKILCWLGFHSWASPVNHAGSWFRVCECCQKEFQVFARGRRRNEWRDCSIMQDSGGRFYLVGTNGNRIYLEKF